MAHAEVIMYATPKKHRLLQAYVNETVVFERQGLLRYGYDRPTMSEIRLYDLRVKDLHMAAMLGRLQVHHFLDNNSKTGKLRGLYVFRWLVRGFRALFGLRAPPSFVSLPREVAKGGWHNAWVLGCFDDLKDDGEDVL